MRRTDRRLALALALTLSLLAHLLPFLPALLPEHTPKPPPAPLPLPLQALLKPLPDQPPLQLAEPEPVAPTARPTPSVRRPGPNAVSWQQEIRRQFSRQQQRGEFYPPEAIARRLQGEVLVLLMLDTSGNVVAARVEQGSGHRLLDDAALAAVRALHSLPADAPRETLLPVRFRLD